MELYYELTIDKTGLAIVRGSNIEGRLVIPAEAEYAGKTYPVVEINYNAFRNCHGLASIVIPNTINKIWGGSFEGCSGLEEIIVEPGNKVYDSRENCNAIIKTTENTLIVGCKNTVIPNTVTRIGPLAFHNRMGLRSIRIPDSVVSVENDAFSGCTGLTSIELPNSLECIGKKAFSGCIGLTSIVIPESVTTICASVFSGCAGLASISIPTPNSLQEIDREAFAETPFYQNDSNWSDGVLYIGDCLIRANKDLLRPDCQIKEGMRLIANGAFGGCDSLTEIVIPESVQIIGGGAFDECSNLNVVIAQRKEYLYIQKKNLNDSHASFDGCKNVRRQCRRSKIIDKKYLGAPVAFSAEWVFQALSIPFTILLSPLVLLFWPLFSLLYVSIAQKKKLREEGEKLKWHEAIGIMLMAFITVVGSVNLWIARFFEKIVTFMVKPFRKRKRKRDETQIE